MKGIIVMLSFLNASLQTVATGLVVYGGFLIAEQSKTVEGIALCILGLVAYLVYELTPTKAE